MEEEEREQLERDVFASGSESRPVGHAAREAQPETVEIEDSEEELEEAQAPRVSRAPDAPSAQEVREHKIAHLPFRSWCIQCTQGRGHDLPHAQAPDDGDPPVPEICIDYFYIGQEGTPGTTTALAVRDKGTKALFGHVVPTKANLTTGWPAHRVVDDIEWLGYKKVLLKGDQEQSITALMNKIAQLREHPTLMERSPVGDSKANGRAERAVQAVEEQLRTMRLGLEQRLKGPTPPNHPVIAWLTEHATDVVNKLYRRKNGRTSYELVKGKPYRSELAEFGQRVLYRLPGKFRGGRAGCGGR